RRMMRRADEKDDKEHRGAGKQKREQEEQESEEEGIRHTEPILQCRALVSSRKSRNTFVKSLEKPYNPLSARFLSVACRSTRHVKS
ncbi:hypothetical protein HK097_000354, partial [Rhizophlyctis rosea]